MGRDRQGRVCCSARVRAHAPAEQETVMTQPPWGAPVPGRPQEGQDPPEQPAESGQPAGFGQPGWAPGPPGPGAQPGWPAQPGWAPGPQAGWARDAPAPGAVPLRPLGVGDILSGAFTLIRQNPAATLGLTALTVTALAVTVAIIVLIASQTAPAVAFFALVPALAALGLQLGGLVTAMGQSLLGRKITIREAVRRSRTGPVVAAILLLAVIFLAIWIPPVLVLKGWGVIPVLLLTAWLGVMLSLTIPVVVLERRGPIAAIGRSWRLVLGSYWRVFGTYLLTYLIMWVLSLVISLPLQLVSGLAGGLGGSGSRTTLSLAVGLFAIGEIVITSLALTIETGVLVLVYADMRMRKEGMDLALRQAAQSQQLSGDEFAASGLSSAYTGGAYPGTAYPGTTYPDTAYPGTAYPGTGYPGTGYPGPAAGGYPAGPPAT